MGNFCLKKQQNKTLKSPLFQLSNSWQYLIWPAGRIRDLLLKSTSGCKANVSCVGEGESGASK